MNLSRRKLFFELANLAPKPHAVSFLQYPAKDSIIGWTDTDNSVRPDSVEVNDSFEGLLHKVVAANIHKDPTFKAHAVEQKSGYLNVSDQRIFVTFGRVPDPEDIIGTVRLEDGQIVQGSYEKFPTHRLVTTNGMFQLTDFLHDRLIDELELGKSV